MGTVGDDSSIARVYAPIAAARSPARYNRSPVNHYHNNYISSIIILVHYGVANREMSGEWLPRSFINVGCSSLISTASTSSARLDDTPDYYIILYHIISD